MLFVMVCYEDFVRKEFNHRVILAVFAEAEPSQYCEAKGGHQGE